jgi:hypothetical protein
MTPELQSDLAWLRGRGYDLTGRTFGNLEVLEYAGRVHSDVDNTTPSWRCRCKCGNVVVLTNVRNKISCGCLSRNTLFRPGKKNGQPF